MMSTKEETGRKTSRAGDVTPRSRASSVTSNRSEKFGRATPAPEERLTPIDADEERMSVCSSTVQKPRTFPKWDDFEKECSYGNYPDSEHKLDLAMVPVISDQLLFDIVNKERTYEQIDVHLFVKKSLDLLSAKNALEAKNEQLKAKVAQLEATNKQIRETTVKMQARVEQEEEYISNMLLKRIQKLKNDKESLALKYEQEEEFLTNDLSRKLSQLEGERDELVAKLSQEQSWVVNNLLAKIRKLEVEIQSNRKSLDQLRKEKIDLENSLEHEQEALFNTLGKRMDQLEAEKRRMQTRLETRDSRGSRDASPAPMPPQSPIEGTSSSHVFASPQNIRFPSGDRSIDPHGEDEVLLLKAQVSRLRSNVSTLNSRVAQLEREKREGKANYQKFTSLIRKKPIPDYKEFLDFLEQLEPRDCSSASDSGLSHMTLPSPAHSDDAMPSASGDSAFEGSPKPKVDSASRSRCTSSSDLDRMDSQADADSRDSIN